MRLPPLCRYFRFGGSFWGTGVLIWGPFWVSVWGLGVEVCRQQLKTSKIAPLCSARPVVPKRFPPSVLAVRRDLRVFPYPKSHKNAPITRDSLSPGVQTGGSNSQSARYLQHLAWPAAAKTRESRGPGRAQAKGFAVRALGLGVGVRN